MSGNAKTPPQVGAPSPRVAPSDPQWERAHQAWHLIIASSADELGSKLRQALFRIVRAKKSERANLLRSLPGAVRKGARVDLADLERELVQAGIPCSLEYIGASQGNQP
jgi:hypothetical protein